MSRGILSIYWGDDSKLPIERLKTSVQKFHPELPHEIIKVDAPSDDASSLKQKALMFSLSPFDETLFLDLDTVVMGKLDFGFEKAKQFGIAICICEAPWARRYQKIFSGDQIEYNTGVIFFTRQAGPIFDRWIELAEILDTSILGVNNEGLTLMPANDQGSFAMAIDDLGICPFVLPLNWNYRPIWNRGFFGPIKIWHDYSHPPPFFDELIKYYSSTDAIIQYHRT